MSAAAEVEYLAELHEALLTGGPATWRDWSCDLAGLPAGTRADAAIWESGEALRDARAALNGGEAR